MASPPSRPSKHGPLHRWTQCSPHDSAGFMKLDEYHPLPSFTQGKQLSFTANSSCKLDRLTNRPQSSDWSFSVATKSLRVVSRSSVALAFSALADSRSAACVAISSVRPGCFWKGAGGVNPGKGNNEKEAPSGKERKKKKQDFEKRFNFYYINICKTASKNKRWKKSRTTQWKSWKTKKKQHLYSTPHLQHAASIGGSMAQKVTCQFCQIGSSSHYRSLNKFGATNTRSRC